MIDRRRMMTSALALAFSPSVLAQQVLQAGEPPLSDDKIRQLLRERIDARESVGFVVGVIEQHQRRTIGAGVFGKSDARVPDANTVFGIASLTKPFVALLLADAVQRGELNYEASAQGLLPATVRLPQRGRPITLLDLATHTAGLPHDLPNRTTLSASAITIDEARRALYEYLAEQQLSGEPGTSWSYSNLDYALIGHILERRTGLDYATLLDQRITNPLGMRDTRPEPTATMRERRASPHSAALEPAAEWNKPWMGRPLQSTVNDLLKFIDAWLHPPKSPLANAMAAMLKTSRPAPTLGAQQAVGWLLSGTGPTLLVGHSGAGGGFSSTALFDPAARSGVVLLSNTELLHEDLARHVLRPSTPLKPVQTAFVIEPALLDRYAGNYQDDTGATTAIWRDGNNLQLVMPAGYKAPLTPKSNTSFFVRGYAGLTAEFEVGANGSATTLRWTLNGKVTVAKRVGSRAASAPAR